MTLSALNATTIANQEQKPQTPPPRPATLEEKRAGDALIAKAVGAMGGAAVTDRIKSLKVETLGRRRLPSGEIVDVPAVSAILFPDKYFHEVTLPVGKVRTLISGKEAFLISAGETTSMPEHEKFNIEDRILRLPLVLLRKRGDLFFEAIPEGKGDLNGRAVERLRIQLGQRKQTHVVIDAETSQILQVRYRERTMDGETGAEISSNYSDYRVVKGLSYPFKVVVSVAGRQEFSSETRTLLIDEGVDATLFEIPKQGKQ